MRAVIFDDNGRVAAAGDVAERLGEVEIDGVRGELVAADPGGVVRYRRLPDPEPARPAPAKKSAAKGDA